MSRRASYRRSRSSGSGGDRRFGQSSVSYFEASYRKAALVTSMSAQVYMATTSTSKDHTSVVSAVMEYWQYFHQCEDRFQTNSQCE